MALEESAGTVLSGVNNYHQTKTVCLHTFADLANVSPAIFVYLLKQCYVCGTRKATPKFRALQELLLLVLQNSPHPGLASFVVRCLYLFSILGHPYTEGFSHLLMYALRRIQSVQTIQSDFVEAQTLAAKLFMDATAGFVIHELNVLVKLLEVFDVKLLHIGKAICGSEVNDNGLERARAYIESYVWRLIENNSYVYAVALLERFSLRLCDESFLLRMMQGNHFKTAEKWATFMGRPMLCVMVKKYMDMNMLKNAYVIIKNFNLQQEFPEAYHMCKESFLKKLAEKDVWDLAEAKTHGDRQLVEYLVYLAMEKGYSEKVDELCERYSLEGFLESKESKSKPSDPLQTRYLNLKELAFDEVRWVDEADGLVGATSHIEGCKVVGVDSEWKPNYEKGSKPNKVSIIQIAGEKIVFIIDLIKLSVDEPDLLNNCFKRILHSPSILKLGYNFQCDLRQLAHSYTELECFKHYEMLLDIQNMFKEPKGGLSGLAKKILGAGLNKTKRNSNWEQRPLSQNQIEYAALDAAVLVHIFRHVRNQTLPSEVNDKQSKVEWRSNLVSHLDSDKKIKTKAKKKPKSKSVVADGSSVSELAK